MGSLPSNFGINNSSAAQQQESEIDKRAREARALGQMQDPRFNTYKPEYPEPITAPKKSFLRKLFSFDYVIGFLFGFITGYFGWRHKF